MHSLRFAITWRAHPDGSDHDPIYVVFDRHSGQDIRAFGDWRAAQREADRLNEHARALAMCLTTSH